MIRKWGCRGWVALVSVPLAGGVQGQPVHLVDPNLEAVMYAGDFQEWLPSRKSDNSNPDDAHIPVLSTNSRSSFVTYTGDMRLLECPGYGRTFAAHTRGGAIIRDGEQGDPEQAGLTSRELGARGGNVASLDGSVRWKSVDQMKPCRGSRFWGSGGCFAFW